MAGGPGGTRACTVLYMPVTGHVHLRTVLLGRRDTPVYALFGRRPEAGGMPDHCPTLTIVKFAKVSTLANFTRLAAF